MLKAHIPEIPWDLGKLEHWVIQPERGSFHTLWSHSTSLIHLLSCSAEWLFHTYTLTLPKPLTLPLSVRFQLMIWIPTASLRKELPRFLPPPPTYCPATALNPLPSRLVPPRNTRSSIQVHIHVPLHSQPLILWTTSHSFSSSHFANYIPFLLLEDKLRHIKNFRSFWANIDSRWTVSHWKWSSTPEQSRG